MKHVKQILFNQCQTFINSRFEAIQMTIDEIQLSLTSETKSSAGDKHETGRAMLQLEREKAGEQLAEIQKLKLTLQKIDLTTTSQHVRLGSVVFTSSLNYFIAISAGELIVDNESFYAISPLTPIGKLLLGKQEDDTFQFRDQEIEILRVL